MPDEFAQTIETEWFPADPTSHLKQMRFTNNAFSDDGQPSVLYVVFREKTNENTGKHYPEASYRYESNDHAHLRQTYERMTIAESPGIILHAELIRRGNTGTKLY